MKVHAEQGAGPLPTLELAVQAFRTLGNRPEEMLKALRQLMLHLPAGANPDESTC